MGKIEDIERQVQALSLPTSSRSFVHGSWNLTGRCGTTRSNVTFKQADSTPSLRRPCGTTQPGKPRRFDAPCVSGFLGLLRSLPQEIQNLADAAYTRLKQDPRHLSLHFKKVGRFWSARVGGQYRALAVETVNTLVWFWIGSHATTTSCSANKRRPPAGPASRVRTWRRALDG